MIYFATYKGEHFGASYMTIILTLESRCVIKKAHRHGVELVFHELATQTVRETSLLGT